MNEIRTHKQRLVLPEPEGPSSRNVGRLAAALDRKTRKWIRIGMMAMSTVTIIKTGVEGENIESIFDVCG